MAAEENVGQRVDLDDPASYEGVDPSGMFGHAEAFPSQVEEAARIGRDFSPPAGFRNPKHVVLSGMGGSAVTGDFLAGLCEDKLAVPFMVNRNYRIPAFVSRDTLFIASSHSGNTEETLSATSAALRREARIICITTGGKLKSFAQRHAGRRVRLIEIPAGDPPMQPRAALGYSLIPLVRAFETLGLCPGAGRQIGEAISLLKQLRDRSHQQVPTEHNAAKQLALALHGRIPWIQGTVGIMSAVAYRWHTQCNENSKTLAYSSEYSELNHNEVIGWERAEQFKGMVSVIMLRSPSDDWRIRARVDITRKKLVEPKAPVHLIEAEGRSPLAQLMWTVYLADWVTLYLALLNGVDPGSIESINTLKSDLEKLQRPRK